MYRKKMKAGKDKKVFSRTADCTKKINTEFTSWRGGIRL